jgi:hypothetical protein
MKYFYEALLIATIANAVVLPNWPAAIMVLSIAGFIALQKQNEHEISLVPAVDLDPLHTTIADLTMRLKMVEKDHAEILKQAQETQRILSGTNMGLAFRPRVAKRE